MTVHRRLINVAVAGGVAMLLAACGSQSAAPQASATPLPTASPAPAPMPVPGLGDLMLAQQARHAKLWWAGQAKNWPLAQYEVDELTAGFDQVVQWHPKYKKSPTDPKDAVPVMATVQLAGVADAIAKKDAAAFATAYDDLTNACNACHSATDYALIVIKRPATNAFGNQEFGVVKPAK
jgi:hypothetical protein